MNRSEFEYLFIHANSLAELALRQMASALEQDPSEDDGKPSALSEEDRDAQALALLKGMDMSGMDDAFRWEDDKHDAEVQRVLEELSAAPTKPAPYLAPDPVSPNASADGSSGLNLRAYLDHAYASLPQLAARIDACMRHLDQRALAEVVSALPIELPPLSEPLSDEGFAQWLAAYQANHAALQALVVLIRSSGDEN